MAYDNQTNGFGSILGAFILGAAAGAAIALLAAPRSGRETRARLKDVAHDLGNIGEDGRGFIGAQNMLGKIDIVMGSFSKTFASNGGFVSCRPPARTRGSPSPSSFASPGALLGRRI